jgi:hypothetical protein
MKKKDELHIDGVSVSDGKYVTIITTQELTPSETIDLNTYVNAYSDFSQELLDEEVLKSCKLWAEDMMTQFSIKNMNRKRTGLMGRIELKNIMNETHASLVDMCFRSGSLDTLHGILFGFPDEGEGPEAPYTFNYVWQEDIDWIKQELNIFLSKL